MVVARVVLEDGVTNDLPPARPSKCEGLRAIAAKYVDVDSRRHQMRTSLPDRDGAKRWSVLSETGACFKSTKQTGNFSSRLVVCIDWLVIPSCGISDDHVSTHSPFSVHKYTHAPVIVEELTPPPTPHAHRLLCSRCPWIGHLCLASSLYQTSTICCSTEPPLRRYVVASRRSAFLSETLLSPSTQHARGRSAAQRCTERWSGWESELVRHRQVLWG